MEGDRQRNSGRAACVVALEEERSLLRLLWLILFVLSWPLALLVLVLYPFLWRLAR